MNRRNFFKGLLTVAAAAIAAPLIPTSSAQPRAAVPHELGPYPIPSYDPKAVKAFEANLRCEDVTWTRRLRILQARMTAHNIPTFPDGLYRGNVGKYVACQILSEDANCLKEGDEIKFGGFRLQVKDDRYYGVQAWGRP